MDDEFGKLIANVDQAIAEFGVVAKLNKGVFDAYIKEGFAPEQAMQLVLTHVKNGYTTGEGE